MKEKLFCASLITLLIFSSLHASQSFDELRMKKETAQTQTPQGQEKPDSQMQLALTTLATMLTSFGCIVAQPHNPAIVGPNIVAMIASMVRLVKEIMKDMPLDRSHPITADIIAQYLLEHPKFKKECELLIVTYAELLNNQISKGQL